MLYGESERYLFALVQSGAVSQQAGQNVDQLLVKELGPIDMSGAQPMQGPPDQMFLGLEHQLRGLVQAKALSEEGFGCIYAVLAEERAPQSTTSRGIPAVDMSSRGSHGGTFSRLGNIVMNSAASGFGFTLGGNAANSLWHGLFGRH
ncbi:hypothetical protein WJX74_002147 [Apatococcus lobatus]|uniref:Beta-tubulin n=1 Tax=Apatococcus lobatus TaxID=904363 RepID=A0AAW1QLT8_9CHLO